MRTLLTKASLLKIGILSLSLLMLISCGKDNKVSPSQIQVPSTSSNPGVDAVTTAQLQQIDSIKSQYSCNRLPDVVFHTSNVGTVQSSKTTIGGVFQNGPLSGYVSNVYVGRSIQKDIIVVTKISSGAQVVGYNVSISFCLVPPLIVNEMTITGLQAPLGITINEALYQNLGTVDAAKQVTVQQTYIGELSYLNQYRTPIITYFGPLSTGSYQY